MPVTLELTGRRFRFSQGSVRADMTNAVVALPVLNVEKSAGIAMTGTAALHFGDQGAVSLSDVSVSGQGLDAHGAVTLDPNGNLINASFADFRAGANNDFALVIAAMPGGGLAVKIAGASVDATGIFGGEKIAGKSPQAADMDATLHYPLSINATVDRAVFHNDLAFHKVSLAVSFTGNERLTGFRL